MPTHDPLAALVDTHRRRLLAAGLALPASLAATSASGQQAGAPQDWFALIKQQHQQIRTAFDTLLAPDDQPWDKRQLQFRTVNQLLNAHQFAEQNVVYPALARVGMAPKADHLYSEEAHIKEMKAKMIVLAQERGTQKEWTATAHQLRDAVLQHALEDEEKETLPQLHQKLDPSQNQLLSTLYPQDFGSVLPVRR